MAKDRSKLPPLRPASRWKRPFAVALTIGTLLGLAALIWRVGFREVTLTYADEVEHYKYGSIGDEQGGGLPYWVWIALPRVFPEYLPGPSPGKGGNGGYAAFGMTWEEARKVGDRDIPGGGPGLPEGSASYSVPVGFSIRTIGVVPMVAMNCALCHSSAVRRPGEEVPTIFPGGPNHQLDSLGYLRFLFRCANDPKFTPDILMESIEYNVKLSPLESLAYRTIVIPATRKGLLALQKQYAWTETLAIDDGQSPKGRRTDWGRGRIDPFNPVKFGILGISPEGDNTTGNSDMPPIWNMERRAGMAFHWDGLNDAIHEVVLSSALGDGSRPKTIELAGLDRVEAYLKKSQPPRFDAVFPGAIDLGLVKRGEEAYRREKCQACHDFGGERTGKVIPIEEVGTDPERHKLWTAEAARRYNAYAKDYPWKFSHFRGTDGPGGGYVAVPLDGVWIRAPFLHNGSVPTLEDLFKPSGDRPKFFHRGNDLYDVKRGGFRSEDAVDGWRRFTPHDTKLRGNGNGGHLWGTEMPPVDKTALVEYLKTL